MTVTSKVSMYLPKYLHTYMRPICVRLKRLYNLGSGGRTALKEMVPYVEKEEVPDCDYEKMRMKNIAEQKAMFLEQLKKSATTLSNSMTFNETVLQGVKNILYEVI